MPPYLPGRKAGPSAPYGFAATVRRAFAWPSVSAAMVALATLAMPAAAQSIGTGRVGGTIGLTSQLVDRGVALSAPTPIVQGALTWSSPSGWSAGVSASSETRQPRHVRESMAQIDRAWSLSGDWQAQVGLTYYWYNPDSPAWRLYDRAELGAALIYRDVLTVGVTAAQMTHASGHGPRLAADMDMRWPVAPHLSLSAGLGVSQYLVRSRYRYYSSPYYEYGHLGLVWENGPWRLELKRIVTQDAPRPRGASDVSPWNAAIAWSF